MQLSSLMVTVTVPQKMTHQRRTGWKSATTVTFTDDMKLTMKKDHFLKVNCQTCHLQADADLVIVQTAVESARRMNTLLIGDDTDLLILLCYYREMDAHKLFFQPEPKANSRRRIWNMKVLKEKQGQDVCNNLLFIHAILGCDTTSHIHGIGKGASLKKFLLDHHFRDQAQVF